MTFEPAHLADLDPPVFDRRQMQRFAAGYRPAGPAFSLIEEGRALGCAGIMIEGDRGRAWAFLSDALRQRRHLLHRTAMRSLPVLLEHYAIRCVTAEAHADFAAARQWLERLGFRYENFLPRFAGTTEDYVRYRLCQG
ncbi:MAG: hypothetical protein RLN99_00945 [Kiloniellaceae bacterium]